MIRAVFILSLFLFSTLPALAGDLPFGLDAYVGAQGGWGGSRIWSNHDPALAARENVVIDRHAYAPFWGVYGGVGYGIVAAEIGYINMPGYHSYVEALNPSRHTVQTITGNAPYARILLRAPLDWTIRPYAFGGAARVHSTSKEIGVCPTCQFNSPEFTVQMQAARPYVGAGLEVSLYGPISGRVEYGYIPRASSSFWSGTRDYSLGSVALQVRF